MILCVDTLVEGVPGKGGDKTPEGHQEAGREVGSGQVKST